MRLTVSEFNRYDLGHQYCSGYLPFASHEEYSNYVECCPEIPGLRFQTIGVNGSVSIPAFVNGYPLVKFKFPVSEVKDISTVP